MAYVRLSERYFGAEDSDVEIIDTIAERRKRGMKGSFSYKLIERINEVLSDGGQILLLRARRAYSPAVQCVSCGDIPRCPHCNVPLSYHRQEGVLMCHYCGWRTQFDAKCWKCGGALEPVGAGTQKIEEEAAALFPSARIARLDSDTASAAGRENEIIREFSRKKIDILVGTQIIAKGFDFDGLSMVAVIGADSLVGQQDFRADERSVQLLEQFRGRCGRRGEKGLFVIQTAQPSHPVYRVFARSDEDGVDVKSLMDNMLSERFQFGYPPFSRIVKIIVKDTDEGRLDRMSLALAGSLRSRFGVPVAGFVQGSNAGITVTGPFAPPVDKQSDSFIRDIRVSLRKDKSLASNKSALASTVSSFEAQYSYAGHVALDVDPL
jgi:primosomal protein N' (replication factor Y)